MKVESRIRVEHPPERVWAYFGRLAEVTECMPGASLREPPGEREVKFQLDVKLGPMRAAFVGEAEVERDEAERRGVIRGTGRDRRSGSRAKGEVSYRVLPADGGAATEVEVAVEFSLAGSLAQFSRGGIVNDLAARLSETFASNLQARLDALESHEDDAAEGKAPERALAAAAEPKALEAGGLLWSVLWARVCRALARLLGRG